MQTFTTESEVTTGERSGRVWRSLYTGMTDLGMNEASFAAALSKRAGKEITPRAVDSWLRGQRQPGLENMLIISSLVKMSVEFLAADHPKKISRSTNK